MLAGFPREKTTENNRFWSYSGHTVSNRPLEAASGSPQCHTREPLSTAWAEPSYVPLSSVARAVWGVGRAVRLLPHPPKG